MGMQLALPTTEQSLKGRLRLPPSLPQFNTVTYRLFTALWLLVFALAVGGPLIGSYIRYTEPPNNSQLLLGSRAGFAVSPRDATLVRFPVGPQNNSSPILAGDRIVAIYGLPMPRTMPVDEQALAAHANDPAYIAMGNLLFGTDQSEVPLTLRDPNGHERDVTVTTGEQHIDAGARALGISPQWLSFIDVLQVLFYPFLLWAAWLLHHRNSRDVVSSLLSLAVLLTIAAEQPSSVFLSAIGMPRMANVAIYDLGNILLLAGILLFPRGDLTWRVVALILCLPLLMFLHGQPYQAYFVIFMAIGVIAMLRRLHNTQSSEQRQQIRWALLGISAYAVLRCISILCDFLKWSTASFAHQLLVEMGAGISFALAVLLLQFGLLVALLRYRLYDAEIAISRSANFALITLAVAAVFGAAADAVKQLIYNYYGNSNSEGPVVIAAAIATILINPIQDRIQQWSEKKFQKNLFLLREDLPGNVRDMRETASLAEMLDEILFQVERGVRAVRGAIIVDDSVLSLRGVAREDADAWRIATLAARDQVEMCKASDRLFPIRVALVPSSDEEQPIGYLLVGPRPDGSVPSREEQKALCQVSEEIARGIRTVIKREGREAEISATIAENARRIEQLEALLGRQSPLKRRSRRSA
jgi:hypothetical protein